jgi:hypothetical protein
MDEVVSTLVCILSVLGMMIQIQKTNGSIGLNFPYVDSLCLDLELESHFSLQDVVLVKKLTHLTIALESCHLTEKVLMETAYTKRLVSDEVSIAWMI